VKGSNNKKVQPFIFNTCFNIAKHFDHIILLGQNFLEKHKIYSHYDDQGKGTTNIVWKKRLDYITEKKTCPMTIAANEGVNLKRPVKDCNNYLQNQKI